MSAPAATEKQRGRKACSAGNACQLLQHHACCCCVCPTRSRGRRGTHPRALVTKLTPYPAAANALPGQLNTFQNSTATATADASPPRAPSTVFLGLMSVSLVRPRFLPTKYAPVSAAMMHATVVSVAMRPTVRSGRNEVMAAMTCSHQEQHQQQWAETQAGNDTPRRHPGVSALGSCCAAQQ